MPRCSVRLTRAAKSRARVEHEQKLIRQKNVAKHLFIYTKINKKNHNKNKQKKVIA